MEHESSNSLVSCFAVRLNEMLNGESLRSFARRTNLSETAIRKYSTGESTPNLERLVAIAQAGGVSVQWLATGERLEHKETEPQGKMEDEFVLIPGYNIQVSCGHGAINCEQLEPSRHLAFRRKWLKYKGFNEKDLAIVWAKGDSMHPTISNNDTLVVHIGRKKISDGNIYVLRNDDQLWVKRVQVTPTSWELISDNEHYDKISVPKDEQHTFEVVGQVVHIAKDID